MDSPVNAEFLAELDHFGAMFMALSEEVEQCHSALRQNDTPVGRRLLVRSVLACIEGCTYRMKQMALANARREAVALSSAEISALEEQVSRVEDNGEVKTRMLQISTVANLRLLVSLGGRCFRGTPPAATLSPTGWETCKRAVTARNRLTHPKDESSLSVTDNEVRDVMDTFQWATTIFMWLHALPLSNAISQIEARAKIPVGESEASTKILHIMKRYHGVLARISYAPPRAKRTKKL